MEKRILLTLFLVALFLAPIITASTTEITVKTKSDHKLLVTILQSGEVYSVIQSFAPYKNTGTLGQVKYTLTTSEKSVNIKLDLIAKDGTGVLNKNLEDVPTGEPIFINLFPGNVTFTTGNSVTGGVANTANTTPISAASNTTNSTNETTQTAKIAAPVLNDKINTSKSNFSISGYVSQLYKNNLKTILYIIIIIGIIIAILIVVFIVRKLPRRNTDHYITRHKPESTPSSSNPSLIQAERKLKEAQQQIESIKRRNDEIRDAERKLHEDSIRLEKLKRGY
jgi:hypothetical protein